ncbi:MAG: hypothetical protein APR63_02920 [Desulfuromonas sp. SDB]|nr:MAG: hypothetical protein APR63_02920 [Desulfuromonas sp. SDB]
MKIYYFSGTGNSLAVGKDIAERLNASLIPAINTVDEEVIEIEDEVVGFVFPVYAFKPPPVFQDLIKKIENIQQKYLFAVCTYGITPSHCLKYFAKKIKYSGGTLSGGFAAAMPHNVFDSNWINHNDLEKLINNWKIKLDFISDYIDNRREGKIESAFILKDLFRTEIIRMIPVVKDMVVQVIMKGSESLAFSVSENCNGCGICECICPGDNIRLIDNFPCWLDHCLGCLACMHWCPQHAVNMGNGEFSIKCYHHPVIAVSEMVLKDKLNNRT